jgi:S1-C subfamily serine protease
MANAFTDFSNGLTAAVEKAGASTVTVDARKRYPASGIAYAEDLVLTADHVVTREEDIKIMLPDGKSLAATIAGRDPGSDLAVLRLAEKALSPAQTSDEVKVGQLVLAIGRPGGEGVQASWGIVTSINGPARTFRGGMLDEFIRSETTPYPGFSGGPLINAEGEVLGLNTSGLTRGSSLTIPNKVAWRIAEALATHGSVKRGYLGVRTQPVEIPDASRQELQREQDHGLLVLWLEEGGPAANGGLLVGDILVAVNGQSVGDPDDLVSVLNSETVGKAISVEVVRGGRPETVQVTVGERK